MKRSLATALGALLVNAATAQAMTIVLTFDSTVTSNPNSAAIQSACTYAANLLASHYTNAITVRIKVVAQAGTSTFGSSTSFIQGFYSYAQVKGFLAAAATTPDDTTAVASLGATDPTGGGNFALNFALAKALGQRPASDAASDGTFTFGAGHSFTFDPNNRGVAGKFDFIGLAAHEFSEIMGRISGLNRSPNFLYVPHDLFRYTAAGVRNLSGTPPTNVYFSPNGGAAALRFYSNQIDLDDWDSATPDSFNQFASSGVVHPVSVTDFRVMDVIGYALAPACAADLNGDGTVGTADLTALLVKFGQGAPTGSAAAGVDINHDGTVNTADLTALLVQFGHTCG